ncbi:hypothetical protein JCM8097_000960 [Rhodosporidiobolus ruineniae]
MPPPPLHPSLPPRPPLLPQYNAPLHARPLSSATGQPLQPGGTSAGIPRVQSRESTPLLSSLPSRPAFLPQTPGSPRLNAPSPLPHSPKVAPGGAGGGTTPAWTSQQQAAAAAAAEDPWTHLPSFPKPEALRTSWGLVELGEGWEVRWRAWKGPAIVLGGQGGGGTPFPTSSRPASPGPSSASASASTSAAALLDYDPFAARPDAVSHLPLPSSSASHPKPSAPLPSASLPGSLAPTPEASTSTAPPPAKKPKRSSSSTVVPRKSGPTNAFDELLAKEMAVSPSSAAATDASGEPQQKKKGRLPKAVREAQAAAAAAAAAQQAATSPSSSTAPNTIDLPPPSPSLGVSQSSAADPAPLPEPEPEAGPSAAQALRERLEPLRSTNVVGADPVRAALRAVKEKSRMLGKDEDGEERERDALALFAWVEVAPVKLGAGSAKGKEKAATAAEGDAAEESKKRKEREEKEPVLPVPAVQGEGRTFWVFSVVRGGDGADEDKTLDELSFEGLEPLASGHFSHASVFPALYPTPPASPSSALQLPLSSSAKAYPSALALSSHLLTIPTMQHRAPARSEVQAAYEAFREAARGVVLDEMASTAPTAVGHEEGTTAVRMKDGVLYLPPAPSDSASLPSLGPSTAPLAARASLLLPSLNSSSLVLQPRITEEPFAALPRRGRVRRGTPVCLAPTGVEARVIKELRGLSEAEEERLKGEWADKLPPRGDGGEGEGEDEDEERWVLCALELPSHSPSARAKGKAKADQDRAEVVWPRSLVIVDGSRPFPPRSRSSSPARLYSLTLPTSASSDDESSPSSDSSPNSSPDQPPAAALPHTPPAEADEDPPPLSLWARRRRLDPQTRERLAAQALGAGLRCSPRPRPRRESRDDAMALDDEEEHGAEGTFRDPIKRTTGDVWRWMEEEVTRREHEGDEKERAAAAATAEKQSRTTPGGEKQQAEEKGEKGEKAQVQAPPAAAPINMRTPMSLGTASTEAPSPAELFNSLTSSAGHPGSTAFAPLPPSSSSHPSASSTSAPMGVDSDLLALGVYPSPAEPLLQISTSSAGAPPASSAARVPTSTGMSALDAAFSSFDWGDGTFGTSDGGNGDGGGGRGGNGPGGSAGGGGEYDDGLMLGLTDDDFSFFDDPPVGAGVVALPPSTTATSAAVAPLSLGFDVAGVDPLHDVQPHHPDSMGPMILDPFSAAPAADSSLITASEPFSFGEVGAFDPSTSATNALWLSATAPPSSSTLLSLAPPTEPVVQPVEQFFPPYSPAILPPSSSSAFLFTPSLGSAPFPPPTPANPYSLVLPPSYSPTLASSGSAFSPIPFAVSHLQADEKYSQHGGKYGLPSPDSDGERAAAANGKKARQSMLELLPVAVGRRRGVQGSGKKDGEREDAGAARRWFEAVCDPRIAVAERLRLARRNGGKKGNATDDGSVSRSRGWVRSRQHRHSKQLLALPPPPFGTEAPSVEPSEAGESYCSSCSDDDDDEPRGRTAREDRRDVDCDEADGEGGLRRRRSSAVDARARAALGASLLLLGDDVGRVLRTARPASPARGEVEKAAVTIDSAKEITLAVVAEQAMSNREFRDATLALFERKKDELSLVSFHAISRVSTITSRLSSSLGSLSLFDDETALPSLLRQEPPSFLLRTQQCIVEANTASVSFWRPMGFEPLAGSKDVQAFAVYEDAGAELHESVRTWLKMMSGVYQGLRLGEHSLGSISASSNFTGVEDGLIPLPAGLLSDGRGREELKMLYAQLSDFSKTAQNTVVYIISPFASSPLSATSPLAGILHQISKSRAAVVNMHPCPVSLSTILSCQPSLSQRGDVDRLVRLAFSVYDQLQIPVARLRMPQPETFPSARPSVPPSMCGPAVRLCQAPAITLSPSPSKPSPVQFALSWPPQSLEVESRHRFLHVCYGTRRVVADDPSQEWLAVTMIDEKGEQWRNIPRYIKIPAGVVTDVHRVRVVWSFTKGLVDSADIEWRVVVCKLGEPSAVEAKAWDSLLKEHLALSKRPIHVTFACVDLDPALFVSPADPPSRRSSTASTTINEEEGELSVVTPGVALATASSNGSKPPLFDDQAGSFSFTPSEPVSLVSLPLLAPASTYIIHVPRLHTFTHSTTEPFQPAPSPSSPAPISITALHFLLSHASRTSSYTGTLGELVDDVRTSFVELAALGKARWGTSGRVSWHLEAASQALALAEQL